MGGGRENSISMLEAIGPQGRDHICYISDLSKFRSHCPNWRITRSLDTILEEII